MNAVIENAPQLRRKSSTFMQMIEFFLCVVVLWIVSIVFNFVSGGSVYGLDAILLGIVGIAFAILADLLWNLPLLFKKDQKEKGKEYLYRILHSYSFVTGLLLALLCPVGIPWWELALGAFLSIFVMKLLFGGFGKNIFNPAIFGRVFLQLSFATDMKTYIGEKPAVYDVTTGASITSTINSTNGFSVLLGKQLSLADLFFGQYYGTLGETFAFALILICIYLSIRQIIDWRVPVFYIGSIYLGSVLMFLGAGDGGWAFKDALSYTLIGGVFFGGVLCLTDPVTSPTSRSGRVIFALGSALLTLFVRLWTNAPEGVAYSILVMNALTPLLDKVIKGRTRKNLVPIILCSVLGVLIVVECLSYGLTHKIDPSTGKFIVSFLGGELR